MKILLAGDWHSDLHEEAMFRALKSMGHDVAKFAWHTYFQAGNPIGAFSKKIQNRLIAGPAVARLNRELIETAAEFKPDMLFVYRGTHITADTLQAVKRQQPTVKLVGYNNDDPFAKGHPVTLWRHFFKAVPVYDLMLAYRHHNLADFRRIGAKRVELFRSWYIPGFHRPLPPSEAYACDCIFVGHFEDDGRDAYIEALVRSGIRVKLFGPYSGLGKSGWDRPVAKSPLLQTILPIGYLSGESYVAALSSAPIALCFLSKLNQDSYTRRCFEIPAVGAALFSEYTDDLAAMFKDGEEAVFFRTEQELVDKVAYFLKHPDELAELRRRGSERVKQDGHDIFSRMNQLIAWVSES